VKSEKFRRVFGECCEDAYVGGPLPMMEGGDIMTSLSFENRRLEVELTSKEIQERRERWKPPEPSYNYKRGSYALQHRFCTQAQKATSIPSCKTQPTIIKYYVQQRKLNP